MDSEGRHQEHLRAQLRRICCLSEHPHKHLGSMATVGGYKALVDLRLSKDAKGISLAGFLSWLIWRSAYLTRVVSWRNRFYVAVNWATTLVFGRDSSRI
ncbi:hypothetical protein D8674_027967 [Pyrus ussuriensis x Pyrus communis]|uniref:NADH:ubiquinone reductase (non-electrogenic) n=1 Tax=Pyrus ussuriensis x Pyrus communis TaxID=2448454 RepID=A0A5N5IEB8_9ROSA|nr:hypothetical protein D8674_027967 [Pyrus ussuriensis x Pyrus communis]